MVNILSVVNIWNGLSASFLTQQESEEEAVALKITQNVTRRVVSPNFLKRSGERESSTLNMCDTAPISRRHLTLSQIQMRSTRLALSFLIFNNANEPRAAYQEKKFFGKLKCFTFSPPRLIYARITRKNPSLPAALFSFVTRPVFLISQNITCRALSC